MKILSISVAAYNVEKFIRKCLDSFVDSGVLKDVEVIVTDDGSKDATPDIVSEYEARFPGSVVLVRQSNAGPGSTVNSGIRHATGKYFRMVDGDDWVNPKDFALLVQHLKSCDADAVLNHYVMVDHESGEELPCLLKNVEANRVFPFSQLAPSLDISMHNFIVKTEIMKKYVTLDHCFYTDMQYLIFPCGYLDSIVFFDLRVYMYRVALGTQSMNPKSLQKNIAMHEKVLRSLFDYYNEYKASIRFDPSVASYIVSRIVRMAGCQLSCYLSFPPDQMRRATLESFFREIEALSTDVFLPFSRLKTVRLLRAFPFLYPAVSVVHRRRLKL